MSHHSDTLLWFRVDQSINVTSLRPIIMIPCQPVYKGRITQTHYYDSVSTSLWMSHHSDTLLWFRVDQSMNVASLRHIVMIPCRPVNECRITQTHCYDSVSTSLWMSHHSDTLLWFRVDQSMNVASLRHIVMIPCRPVYKCHITQTHYYDSVSISLWMSHHSDTLLWFRVDQSINVTSLRHIIMVPCRSVYECRITQTHYYDSVWTSLLMSHHSDTLLWFRVDQSINVASLRHIIMIPCRPVYECRITQTHYYDSVSTSQ